MVDSDSDVDEPESPADNNPENSDDEPEEVDFQDQVEQLVETGKVQKAAIIGIKDGDVWGTFPEFGIAEKSVQIKNMFTNKPANIPDTFTVDDIEYSFLNTDYRSIKFRNGLQNGCIIVRSKHAIVVGIFDDRVPPMTGIVAIDMLVNYLLGMKW